MAARFETGLPSLSLGKTPWSSSHRYVPVGSGNRQPSYEDSLLSSLDEVSLLSDNEQETNNSSTHRHSKSTLSLKARFKNFFVKSSSTRPRIIPIRQSTQKRRNSNKISNQKYSLISFLPKVLFQQFKVFLNLYFLVIACSQFIPQLRIGYWYTYWGPLLFVVSITMARELYDDVKRYYRDRVINGQKYTLLGKEGGSGHCTITSQSLNVGDVIIINKDQRIPADMILLRTSPNNNGSCFIRTDQLDGETDWKLRTALPLLQDIEKDLYSLNIQVTVEPPHKDLYSFTGRLSMTSSSTTANDDDDNDEGTIVEEPLSLVNTLWANTVLATGSVIGAVIYTGKETRSVLHTSSPRVKTGQVDREINNLTKVLFLSMIILAVIILSLKGFSKYWFVYLLRYVILFSYIIPISLRVNLDMGKLVYSWIIQRDKNIPGNLVRNSTIPEELGRIEYLLSDKTGTLTKNEMVFKKVHLGSLSYSAESSDEVRTLLSAHYYTSQNQQVTSPTNELLVECVLALALCHNVTPVIEESLSNNHNEEGVDENDDEEILLYSRHEDDKSSTKVISFQASSPDEIALVQWAMKVGITLISRDTNSLQLQLPDHSIERFEICHLFPFTSERKRMGIIVKSISTNVITLYIKGADSVMSTMIEYSDWLTEECGNMAREGLRTLVVGKRQLTADQLSTFDARYRQAQLSLADRDVSTSSVIESLENNLELLCVTGVEDSLQTDVRPTLELLRNAGIKVWMLTGDKLETATSIALSSRLIARNQSIYTLPEVSSRTDVHAQLNQLRKKSDSSLIVTGRSLELCLQHYEAEFIELACQCPTVVCCRCSPTHKATVVRLLRTYTKKPICAIGDGGNDVSMIQAANAGVGIVGKEGLQASLAADFSLTQFSHISRLLVWHGRNCYKRSASLSQFVIHRGLIITAMQVVFSAIFYFAALSLYEGILMIGYATVYTMAPVFSLVLDEDVSSDVALTYPELYQDLMKGRVLSLKTFFMWVLVSVYQGGVIMLLGFWLFESQLIHVVAITFTALVLTELLMVALTIRTWHLIMIMSEIVTIAIYLCSLVLLQDYFDGSFLLTFGFIWKTALITILSCLPLFILKVGYRKCAPPSYAKLLKQNSMFRNCCRISCS